MESHLNRLEKCKETRDWSAVNDIKVPLLSILKEQEVGQDMKCRAYETLSSIAEEQGNDEDMLNYVFELENQGFELRPTLVESSFRACISTSQPELAFMYLMKMESSGVPVKHGMWTQLSSLCGRVGASDMILKLADYLYGRTTNLSDTADKVLLVGIESAIERRLVDSATLVIEGLGESTLQRLNRVSEFRYCHFRIFESLLNEVDGSIEKSPLRAFRYSKKLNIESVAKTEMVLNRCLQFDSNYHKIAAQIFDEFLDDCENDSNMIPDRSLCRLGIVAHSLNGTYSRVLEIYDELVMSPMDELNRASDEREETMYRHVLRASMEMYGARAMCERVSRLAYEMPSCLRISASLLLQHVEDDDHQVVALELLDKYAASAPSVRTESCVEDVSFVTNAISNWAVYNGDVNSMMRLMRVVVSLCKGDESKTLDSSNIKDCVNGMTSLLWNDVANRVFEIQVPKSEAGWIIGKNGVTVRRIRKQAGCRFEEIESEDETFRTFRLEGSDRAIQYAYSSVLSELERHGVDTSDRPGDFIGDILGEESSASFATNAFDLLVRGVRALCSSVVFEREAQEFQSFHTFIFQLRLKSIITRIVHSYSKNITRKSTFEYKLNYDENSTRARTQVRNEMSKHLGTFSISMLMRSWMERGNEDDIERTLDTYTEFMPKRNMLSNSLVLASVANAIVSKKNWNWNEFRDMGEMLIHDSRKMLKNYRAFDQKILHVKTVTCVAGFALDMMSQVDETTSPLSDKIASFVLTVLEPLHSSQMKYLVSNDVYDRVFKLCCTSKRKALRKRCVRLIISDLERNDKKQRPVQFWDLPETFKMKHRDVLMWKSLISEDDFDNKSKSLPTTSLHHDATLAKRRANAIVKYASSRSKTREKMREQRKKQ